MTDDAPEHDAAAFAAELREQIGASSPPQVARDPVNVPTIHNWCDAISEANPYFIDQEAAAAGPHGGIVAPPATLNMWTMPGLVMGQQPRRDDNAAHSSVYSRLDAAGFTSVVATNSEQVYERYLRPGDLLTQHTTVDDVSDEKTTALGVGHFVTTRQSFTDADGEEVGSVLFRVFKFKPGTGRGSGDGDAEPPKQVPPPRPVFNMDQAWFWEGLRQRELRIQRFPDDGTLVHPPANANPNTQKMDYDWVIASGRGTLYSHTVVHYPQVPMFDYPHIVALVELEEGTRLVSNLVGVSPDQLEIGMPLEVCFVDTHEDVTVHRFRPATPERRTDTLQARSVAVGDRLPLCPVPLDRRLIVSTALATRDFQDVHHDPEIARSRGSDDIFMNILSTSGFCNRWIGDWAGPDAVFRSLKIRLGVPNYPGDTMTFSGAVAEVGDGGSVTVGFKGVNSLGPHVTGTAEIVLPNGEGS